MTNSDSKTTSGQHGLSEQQLKAASMLASGHSEQEVADVTGVAKRTLQRWKKRHDFQLVVEEYRQSVADTIKEETTKLIVDEIRECRDRYRQASKSLYDTSQLYLDKLKQKVELLDIEGIPDSKLGQTLKQIADSMLIAMQLNREFLGIDEIADKLYEIQPISQNGSAEISTLQSRN